MSIDSITHLRGWGTQPYHFYTYRSSWQIKANYELKWGQCATLTIRNLLQDCVLHFCDSLAGPRCRQSIPPFCGGGLLQVLLRYRTPPPQETLQDVNGHHSLYPPSVTRITSKVASLGIRKLKQR